MTPNSELSGLNTGLLVIAALLPALILCIYVFKKDRAEKEPIGLLLGLLALGAVICYPAAEVEGIFLSIIAEVFAPFTSSVGNDVYFSSHLSYIMYNVAENFIGIALVEEGFKFLVLYLVTRKNKNFNSLFDGIIYSVFVSLGFAALENVLYVTQYGWGNAVVRALLSVPGHMFFAVFMGYYYTMWNLFSKANALEKNYKANGLIVPNATEFEYKNYLTLSLVMPVLAHGFYDFCCSVNYTIATIGLYVFVIFLYIYCFKKIKNMSKIDGDNNTLSFGLVLRKYPYLIEYFNRAAQAQSQNNTSYNTQQGGY